MEIKLVNKTGLLKNCTLGFSWTTLFFVFFVPLFRGDIIFASIMLISTLIIPFLWIIFPFIYNKYYIKSLLEKGYYPADKTSKKY
ncbi:MAG: hypothetical protein IKP65_07090 [Alphaproteobacteria bacterium]|nr:hypothetical protein [Alphaproteobacteria bacterium]